MQFVLRTTSPDVSVGDLFTLAKVLEVNARHCAQWWAEVRPAIDVITGAPPKDCHVVEFVDGKNPPGSLAMHWYDPIKRVTYSRVWVAASSGFKEGHKSIVELAGHEVLEAMLNPRLKRWFYMPYRGRVKVAVEICDMVQTSYDYEFAGAKWPLANFVLPGWFFEANPFDTRYDYAGELTRPGEIGPEGYAILKDDDVWLENSKGKKPFLKGELGKSIEHPWSRTGILLQVSPNI